MKAFGLGEIEELPFLNAPPSKGARSGCSLLYEIGALDGASVLIGSGFEIAHLLVNLKVGRNDLADAAREMFTREALAIDAVLSIQDPCERSFDQQKKADAACRRFMYS